MTGAEFIAKDLGMKVDAAVVEQLGVARKVGVAATATTLIADAASKDEIEMRIAQLKGELAETDSVYDTEKLSERIAKLSGGVAVIKVCARCACCWGVCGCVGCVLCVLCACFFLLRLFARSPSALHPPFARPNTLDTRPTTPRPTLTPKHTTRPPTTTTP